VNDKLKVQKLETWFDPVEMFRQIAPDGVVSKEKVNEEAFVEFGKDDHATTKIVLPSLSDAPLIDASRATEPEAPSVIDAVGVCPCTAFMPGNFSEATSLPEDHPTVSLRGI
jgi:hypothetical protein